MNQKKKMRITIEVEYLADGERECPPSDWNWSEILNLHPEEQASVVDWWDEPRSLQGGDNGDYVLSGGSCFIKPSNSNSVVYVVNSPDGVIVDVYRNGDEMADPVGSMQFFHSDLEGDEHE